MRRTRNISSASPETGQTAPQRTCVACRQVKGKREMVRLVKTQAGNVEVDIPGEKEGRGAYLCRDKACWDKALKSNQLEHAFKGKISQEDKERMIETAKELFKESTSAQG